MPTPRTSVLINNFNHAAYLEHALKSVFEQVPAPDEVIFYDDGSTDDSLRVVERYRDRMVVLARPHGSGTPLQNQARAIVEAFRVCTGELIFLLDGDDAFLPGKIAAYLEAYERRPGTVMVQAPLERIDGHGRYVGMEFELPRHQEDYLAHIYAEHELNIYYPTSALAFSRSFLEQVLPLDMDDGRAIWPDARMALIAPHFGAVAAISRPLSQWRRHARSHTVVKAPSIYRLVRLNQEYFNAFCRAKGLPTISPWRSRYHRRRWFRHYFLPDAFARWYRVLRWATLSEEKKRQMLLGPNPAEMERELNKLRCQGLYLDGEPRELVSGSPGVNDAG